jgi:ferritin-like metal-binding protein YciE
MTNPEVATTPEKVAEQPKPAIAETIRQHYQEKHQQALRVDAYLQRLHERSQAKKAEAGEATTI